MRFTDRSIAALKPKPGRYEVWEDGRTGLGVRVSPSGRKTWVYLYRFDGKPRRMTIGIYPALGLASARVQHSTAREQLGRDIDPGSLRVAQRHADRRAETVSDLIDEYLSKYARPKKRDKGKADERALNREVLPLWGRKKAKAITRRDVIRLLDGIVERGSPIMANRLLEIVRRMFAFGVERGILEDSPCILVKPPSPERARDRTLSADEIKTLWSKLDSAKMRDGTKLALRLLLVTGQRRSEVVMAPWSEFNTEAATWDIPAERTKNGCPHSVPLSSLALDLLAQAKKLAVESGWVFPGPSEAKRVTMTPGAVSQAVHANLAHFGIEPFSPHDLRRTFTSGMSELGIDRLTEQRLLNHLDQTVTGRHYDRYNRWPERVRAMDAWATHLIEITTSEAMPENVVKLPTGRETA